MALDYRLNDRARATIDLDLVRQDDEEAASADLQEARVANLRDFFDFQIQRTNKLDNLEDGSAVRYLVHAELAGRRFERIILDVGFDQPTISSPELLIGSTFLSFAGIPPIQFPAISLDQHVAEKLHAYTRIYGDGRQSTRVKDLIDLVLIAETSTFTAGKLRHAIDATFGSRGTHDVPRELPAPPAIWTTPYRAQAADTGLDPDMRSGHAAAARLLDPLLDVSASGTARWRPESGAWE